MLDYKNIIIKRFALGMSGAAIARELNASKSGVNDFLKAFKECIRIDYPLPTGITNYAIYEIVYGKEPGNNSHNPNIAYPDYQDVADKMRSRKNMTLVYLWNCYKKKCEEEGLRYYQYRQFCENYNVWCEENAETLHFTANIAEKMEVDFAGKTFKMVDQLTGEFFDIVVFVAILPYSQYIYAEGMLSTKEPEWIKVNNHALDFFGGVPAIVVCDNCKQAVLVNQDWIAPELNKDYAEWAEHNHTVIMPAKVKKPKFKSSVENAVGILEKGFFHDLEDMTYFSLEDFNRDLWDKLDELNREPFKKKEHNRFYYWEGEKLELMPLPSMHYEYMERRVAKVSSDYHVRFDNAYYSVDKRFLHKEISIRATDSVVRIYSKQGEFICEWPRAVHKGQWSTNPDHLPKNYQSFGQWNASFFINKASAVGPHTVEVIRAILGSRQYEVQTYRMCIGVLGFRDKYGADILEDCCAQAIKSGKTTYTFIKNTVTASAAEHGFIGKRKFGETNKRGGYAMDAGATSLENLLSRSRDLAVMQGKDGDDIC